MSPVTEHSAEGQREAAEPGELAHGDCLCPAALSMRRRDSILCPGIRAVSGALAFPLRALVTGETRPCPLPRPPPPGLSKGKPVLVQTPHTQEGPHKKTSLIGGGQNLLIWKSCSEETKRNRLELMELRDRPLTPTSRPGPQLPCSKSCGAGGNG